MSKKKFIPTAAATNLDVIYVAMHDPSLPPSERETFGPELLVVQKLQGPIDQIEPPD